MKFSNRTILGALSVCSMLVLGALFFTQHTKQDTTSSTTFGTAFAETANKHQQDLATQIKTLHKSGELDKALEISERALKSDPVDLEAYDARWRLIVKMFSEADAKKGLFLKSKHCCKHTQKPRKY